MAKIFFIVTPAAGHLHPTIPIALALQARGHAVRYITGRKKTALLDQIGLLAAPILHGQADTAEQIAEPVGANRDTHNPLQIYREIRCFLNLMEDGLTELEAIIANWLPDLVVTDFSTPIGVALANGSHLRWITTCTVPSCIRTQAVRRSFWAG